MQIGRSCSSVAIQNSWRLCFRCDWTALQKPNETFRIPHNVGPWACAQQALVVIHPVTVEMKKSLCATQVCQVCFSKSSGERDCFHIRLKEKAMWVASQVGLKRERKHQGFPYIYHALSLLCANTTSIFDVSRIKFCMCAVNSFKERDLLSKGQRASVETEARQGRREFETKKGNCWKCRHLRGTWSPSMQCSKLDHHCDPGSLMWWLWDWDSDRQQYPWWYSLYVLHPLVQKHSKQQPTEELD